MNEGGRKNNRWLIAIALFGIALELVAIGLLASRRISVPIAMPIIIVGMFTAFVPIFAVARRARR
jgi:hypothetical protein